MDGLETILSRHSVREFTQEHISEEALRAILAAGMSGPSCANTRDWSFLVVRDRETLQKMADANDRPAWPLRGADLGILVCGDLTRAFPRAQEYWVVDGAIAAQNMVLAAAALGIGSVWLGTWPQTERVERLRELFSLPDTAVPHSILALGYPDPEAHPSPRPAYEADRVHFEKW